MVSHGTCLDTRVSRGNGAHRLFYTWATPLFSLARKKNRKGEELEQEDLYDLPSVDETDVLVKSFYTKWDGYVVCLIISCLL